MKIKDLIAKLEEFQEQYGEDKEVVIEVSEYYEYYEEYTTSNIDLIEQANEYNLKGPTVILITTNG